MYNVAKLSYKHKPNMFLFIMYLREENVTLSNIFQRRYSDLLLNIEELGVCTVNDNKARAGHIYFPNIFNISI